jgi:hypothetical protein
LQKLLQIFFVKVHFKLFKTLSLKKHIWLFFVYYIVLGGLY